MGQSQSVEDNSCEMLHAPGLPFWGENGLQQLRAVAKDRPLKVDVLAIHGWKAFNSENKAKSESYAKKTADAIAKQLIAHDVTEFKIEMMGLSGCRPTFALPCRDGDPARVNKQTVSHRVRACIEELLETGKLTSLTHSDIVFVAGHSQGGLVGTGLLRTLYSHGFLRDHQIVFLLTIATPHHGVSEAWTQYGREATVELRELASHDSSASMMHAQSIKSCLDHGANIICVGSHKERIVGVASSMADGFHHPNIFRGLWVPPHQAISTDSQVDHQDTVTLEMALLGIRRRNMGFFDDILRFITPNHDMANDIVNSLSELVNTGKIIFTNPKYLPPMLPNTKRTLLDVRAHSKIHESDLVYSFAGAVFMYKLEQIFNTAANAITTSDNTQKDLLHSSINSSQEVDDVLGDMVVLENNHPRPKEWRHPILPTNDDWPVFAKQLALLGDSDDQAKAILLKIRELAASNTYQDPVVGSLLHPLLRVFATEIAQSATNTNNTTTINNDTNAINTSTRTNVTTPVAHDTTSAVQKPPITKPVVHIEPKLTFTPDNKLQLVRQAVVHVMPDAQNLGDAKLNEIIISNGYNVNNIVGQVLDILEIEAVNGAA